VTKLLRQPFRPQLLSGHLYGRDDYVRLWPSPCVEQGLYCLSRSNVSGDGYF
jgi:hypothetical protein